MRKRITLLLTTALTAAALTLGSATAAFAAQDWTGSDKPQFQNKCTGGDKHKNCRNA
jgi:hypothetical protein